MIKPDTLKRLISQALREDAARQDITTNILIPSGHMSQGTITVKEHAVLCGMDIATKVFYALDPHIRIRPLCRDGSVVKPNTRIAVLKGKTRALLSAERTALNFLGRLSGIATQTRHYVQKVRRYGIGILDTRKTTPGLRMLEKYAVRCGGGNNHRSDLSEHILVKDNHLAACAARQSIAQAMTRLRQKAKKPLEIEVDNLLQFKEALGSRPDMILLDNMGCSQMKRAVALTKRLPKRNRPVLEASGGITLRNVESVARTGIDRISIGALTQSSRAIDLSMEITP